MKGSERKLVVMGEEGRGVVERGGGRKEGRRW